MMESTAKLTYWQVFRLIFVLFFLYLMGDAFFRWDGFRYYASFSEFVPSVALITILWSIVAVFAAMLVWLPGRVFGWLCHGLKWRISIEKLQVFTGISFVLGAIVWFVKGLMWADVQTTLQLKLIVFLCVAFTGTFLTWLSRNKSGRWICIIHERITPLVWLFGIWFVFSVPLVAYHTWGKQADNIVSQKIPQFSVADKNRPNIILVTFDVLTARDMSVDSYHRPTTPFISKWAKEASLFTRLEAAGNITTPTTASFMTGKRLWTHQTYHLRGSEPEKSSIENLPLLLKNNGYYTMAFVANPAASVKVLGIADSFDIAPLATEFRIPTSLVVNINISLYRLFGDKIRLHDWIIKGDFIFGRLMGIFFHDFSETPAPAERGFNRFLSVLDDNPSEPFFTWIHLLPPHAPYLPPEPYMGMFDSSPELRTYESQLRTHAHKHSPQKIQPTVDILRARYDEFIRYCDKQFEDFIAQLKIKNKLKNTVIILSSDHGESFEHNYLGHGRKYLYEQVTHIPLIIKEPGQTEGRIINDLTEQIDIPSTILDLADIPQPSCRLCHN